MPRHTNIDTEALLELVFLSPRTQERLLYLARQTVYPGRGRPKVRTSTLRQWLKCPQT